MKKILLACTALLAAVGAYGQGQVAFANTSTTLLSTNVGGNSGTATGAGNYRVGLYVGSVGTPEASLTIVGLATNNALAGRFSGGNPFLLPSPTYPGGTPLDFQVRAWSLAGGVTYAEALVAQAANPAILAGVSALGQVTPTASPNPPAALFGTGAGQLSSGIVMTPGVIPEPSSIALGLLGLGAIALFRRRK
jgi:hypothetical protein